MGRRDNDGKKTTWAIDAGDREKLYAAFLRAKEKNSLLDLRLARRLESLEQLRVQRDGALFNDIFEQKQLVFKYKCQVQKRNTPATNRVKTRQQTTRRAPAVPTQTHEQEQVERSQTVPDMMTSQAREPAKKLDIVMAEHWVGDPSAIRSVRRPRLQPNEMSDHSQPFGQARKLMVDMRKYPSCSRNCNKPGFDFEVSGDVTSRYPPVSTLTLRRQARTLTKGWQSLPALAKASDVNDINTTARAADDTMGSKAGSADGQQVELPNIHKSLTDPDVHLQSSAQPSARNQVVFARLVKHAKRAQQSTDAHLPAVQAPVVQPPLDVLARVKRGNLKVPSLAVVTRRVTQSMDAADHRSITSRGDEVVCDRSSKFQQRRVAEVIHVQATKAAIS